MATTTAKHLKSLHVPGDPVVFPNIWDTPSLQTLLTINDSDDKPLKGVATASYAIATSLGIQDPELTFEQNLARIRELAALVKDAGLPLSVDLQDGYGDRIEEVIKAVVEAGAVGANIEDVVLAGEREGQLYGVEEQTARLVAALKAAKDAGCPEFVLNARCDMFYYQSKLGLSEEAVLEEAVRRGKAYLSAGATTIFYWGAQRGLRDNEVKALVKELDGRVAVKLAATKEALSVRELADIGVARISVGPSLSFIAANEGPEGLLGAARSILGGGSLSG